MIGAMKRLLRSTYGIISISVALGLVISVGTLYIPHGTKPAFEHGGTSIPEEFPSDKMLYGYPMAWYRTQNTTFLDNHVRHHSSVDWLRLLFDASFWAILSVGIRLIIFTTREKHAYNRH